MLLKIYFSKTKESFFIYSFTFKKKNFLVIYQKNYCQKHVILTPKNIFSITINKNYIIVASLHLPKISKISTFTKLLYKNTFYSSEFFSKKMLMIGLGFKIEILNSRFMKLYLNFSHPLFLYVPKVVDIISIKNQSLFLSSTSKVVLDSFSFSFKQVKKPNLYKNKGIFFYNLITSD